MFSVLRQRYLDLLASVYIYNEHQGYRGLERLLEAIRRRYPEEHEFIAAVEKHTSDERKHYRMFRHYFERQGAMPYHVDRTCGYVDRFITIIFRRNLEDLDTEQLLSSDALFFKLCRLIMMTEFRGMKQVDQLLRSRMVQSSPALMKIFRIVERDEPSHCYPYQHWLRKRGGHEPEFEERTVDLWIHYSLTLIKLPLLYLTPRLRRRTSWPDEVVVG